MISLRKLQANRANARASTGPRSAAGKLQSARNARRHGLSVPVWSDPVLSADARILALEIAGFDAAPELRRLARVIAESQIDLNRVRRARHYTIAGRFDDPLLLPISALGAWAQVRALIRIDQLMSQCTLWSAISRKRSRRHSVCARLFFFDGHRVATQQWPRGILRCLRRLR
jgi:hypothetical protein